MTVRESDLLELIAGLARLTEVANRLRQSAWNSERPDPRLGHSSAEEFQVFGTPSLPFGLSSDSELRVLHSCRIVEDGPPEIPEQCLLLAQSQLSPEGIGQSARARRAVDIGFWARATVDTHIPYSFRPEDLSLPSQHCVVLRSCKVWTIEQACRFDSETDYSRFIGEGDRTLVAASFPTLLELHLFAIGANIWTPRLLRWRSRA